MKEFLFLIMLFSSKIIVAQFEHLEPSENIYSLFKEELKYNKTIKRKLLNIDSEPPKTILVITPPFDPEISLQSFNLGGEFYFILNEAKRSIWPTKTFKNVGVSRTKIFTDFESFTLFNYLYEVATNNTAQYKDRALTIDGTRYFFYSNNFNGGSGMTHSPHSSTPVGKLVLINKRIIDSLKNTKSESYTFSPLLKSQIIESINELNKKEIVFNENTFHYYYTYHYIKSQKSPDKYLRISLNILDKNNLIYEVFFDCKLSSSHFNQVNEYLVPDFNTDFIMYNLNLDEQVTVYSILDTLNSLVNINLNNGLDILEQIGIDTQHYR